MISQRRVEAFFRRELDKYLPHLSVDCVVFGFHEAGLKLLLLKWKNTSTWVLPGGYVGRRESLDDAAIRVLRDRTGLARIDLRQFHAFGGLYRREGDFRRLFRRIGMSAPSDAWPLHRVVSIGYYALVDSSRVRPKLDYVTDAWMWHPVNDRPPLAFDHADIVDSALETLRSTLDSPRAAATLLPSRFTMPEFQRLYEAILGRRLDRRNFQKRMLEGGTLERLPERRTGTPHRAPFLYRFTSSRS